MVLAQRNFTAGNKIKFTIDYSPWLNEGFTVSAFTATSDTTDLVISGVTKDPSTGIVHFFAAGGTALETATISTVMTDTQGNIKHDTVILNIIAP